MSFLIGDVGATNARFRLTDGELWQGETVVAATAQYASVGALLDDVCAQLDTAANVGSLNSGSLDGALLAVAGPKSSDGEFQITNTGLRFPLNEISASLGCNSLVVNDFTAQARAVPHLEDLHVLSEAQPTAGTKAILGPGSGLGMATVLPDGEGWRVLAGEGGHASLAPGNHLETELWSVLVSEQSDGHVSWESVLSGPGLENLYRAVALSWGSPPEERSAGEIAAAGVAMDDLICHQTMETFFGLLGSAAANLALTVGATGGVYISGGIVPRYVEFAQSSPLLRRFLEAGPMTHFLERIALSVVTAEEPGLIGARYRLQDWLRTGD